METVTYSTNINIIIQLITGVIGINGIFINIPDKHKILQDILILETIVQFIELGFYVFILKSMVLTTLPNMTANRYMDWVITTPLMLLTSIIYFKYEEYLENNIEQKIEFFDFLCTHKNNIIIITVCNFLMLFFGYLGEIGVIDLKLSTLIGFIFFGITFYIIYKDYAVKSKIGVKLFSYIVTVWGIYGIAAVMTPEIKNNMYNVLDIFAKNFFGLYLCYRITNISFNDK
jgi:bacteriorhodopsin